MSSRLAEPTRRLFFALWPDADVGVLLGRQLANVGLAQHNPSQKQVPAANLHMTLAFPGQVGADRQACLESAAGRIKAAPFRLEINRLDSWPGPRVIWSGPSASPAALGSLAKALQQCLPDCGVEQEKRPFRPHITLARKINRTAGAVKITPVYWPVKRFALVESCGHVSGSIYTVVRTWVLGGE